MGGGPAIAYGTDIYLFWAFQGNHAYKYNTLDNTYTQLADLPTDASVKGNFLVNKEIYLIGTTSSSTGKQVYKYNIDSNTYTKLPDLPHYCMSGTAVYYNDYIYVIGGTSFTKKIYKYHIYSGVSTYFADMPYEVSERDAIIIDDNIYFNNIVNDKFVMEVINIPALNQILPNNSILVDESGEQYVTTLKLNNIDIEYKFKNFFYYENNMVNDIYEKYYGNNTSWIKLD